MQNKIQKIFTIILVSVLIISILSACGKKKDEIADDEIYVYYVNKQHTKLTSVVYKPEGSDPQSKAVNVIDKMDVPPKKINSVVAKPDDVQILGITMKADILYINFASSYYDMNEVDELLYRAATVLSLSQIDGISYVQFTVMSEDLVLDGKVIGRMTKESFVDNTSSDINAYENMNIVVYYAEENGTKLVPVDIMGVYGNNTPIEKTIIDMLINGPSNQEKYTRTVPENLRLLSVHSENGICYVDFDNTFITEAVNVSAEVELYSIVNSLIELSHINKVQISINGETDVDFRDEVTLKYPFTRNLDIVLE